MRKVAIASILTMEPDIIALDEPTATLDPQSRSELVQLLSQLQREQGKTVIVITHRIEEMLPYVDTWIVMKDGRIIFQGPPAELVREERSLTESGLALPECIRYWNRLAARFGLEHEEPCLTAEAIADRLARLRRAHQSASEGGADDAG
jgi:energy-coupling factor transport system ATP-binding protein